MDYMYYIWSIYDTLFALISQTTTGCLKSQMDQNTQIIQSPVPKQQCVIFTSAPWKVKEHLEERRCVIPFPVFERSQRLWRTLSCHNVHSSSDYTMGTGMDSHTSTRDRKLLLPRTGRSVLISVLRRAVSTRTHIKLACKEKKTKTEEKRNKWLSIPSHSCIVFLTFTLSSFFGIPHCFFMPSWLRRHCSQLFLKEGGELKPLFI